MRTMNQIRNHVVMKLTMKIQKEELVVTEKEDGTWVASVKFLRCIGYGMTKRDAVLDFRSRYMVALRNNFETTSGKIRLKTVNEVEQWVRT